MGSHVLEVRAHAQRNTVPARIAFNIRYNNPRVAQGAAAASVRTRIFLISDILPDPGVQFPFQIRSFFPGADVFPLQHLDVVRKAGDNEQVRQLRAQAVIEFGVPAFLGYAEIFGLLAGIGGEERDGRK